MIDAIKQLAATLPLEQHYTWEMPADLPLQIPEDVMGVFNRNVYLKENLAPVLQNDENLNVHYWVIREWGGIQTFQVSERNNQRIREFRRQLAQNRLRHATFGLISSLSKLAAFWHPGQYSIYDSRAVFALNWLIFRHSSDRRIFPQPPGRSAAVSQFDTGTLFKLSGIRFTERDWRTAYHEYCELLCKLSREALGKERPYWIEMLLFVAAPQVIVEDIQSNTTVSINTNAQQAAQADPAHAFFLETAVESSKVISGSPAVGGGAA